MKKKQEEVCCFCGTMFEPWNDCTNKVQNYFCRYECGYNFASETFDKNHNEFLDEARMIARDWYNSLENPKNDTK
tara:strand:- start:162 stop:386 length:225 start_codon:yes stop_codon:yes gene_type:complete